MVGDESGNQQPLKPLLRQEAAQIIMNILGGRQPARNKNSGQVIPARCFHDDGKYVPYDVYGVRICPGWYG